MARRSVLNDIVMGCLLAAVLYGTVITVTVFAPWEDIYEINKAWLH